jgi:antitoxin HicB
MARDDRTHQGFRRELRKPGGRRDPSLTEERAKIDQASPGSALERYLNLPYHVTLVRDAEEKGRPWTAAVEELPGCTSRGRTSHDALSGIEEAMAAWIAAALEAGRDVPEPKTGTGHSGRLLLRMPKTLHAGLTRVAEREGVSLNQFITDVLASAIGWPGGERAGGNGRPKTPISQAPGAEGLTTELSNPSRRGLRRPSSFVAAALAANFVIVALVAIVAIAVLIAAAWR